MIAQLRQVNIADVQKWVWFFYQTINVVVELVLLIVELGMALLLQLSPSVYHRLEISCYSVFCVA